MLENISRRQQAETSWAQATSKQIKKFQNIEKSKEAKEAAQEAQQRTDELVNCCKTEGGTRHSLSLYMDVATLPRCHVARGARGATRAWYDVA